ncbi:MAG: transposase, partial [Planctomycetota bacterium]
LCSLGVFSRDGAFHPAGGLDFWALEEIFRERMLKRMLERGKIDRARVELLRSWRHSGFSVHSERLIAQGARAELESLLEYMQRPPVSLKRLSILEDGRVLYLGTRYHPGLKRDHELVSGLEFVAMLVPHVSLRYQVTIRYYGAISTTIRRQLGWIEQGGRSQAPRTIAVIDDEDSEFVRLRRRSWAQLIRKVWLDDPELCERCGARMRIISALSSPARDDVIRKILESRGEWDPPWLKDGRRRGPPPRATDQPATGDRRSGCPETRIEYDPGYDPTEEWPLEA